MRFYFHLAGALDDTDDAGHDLESIAVARVEAVKFAGDILHDHPEALWLGEELRVEATNNDHVLLFTVIILGVEAKSAAIPDIVIPA